MERLLEDFSKSQPVNVYAWLWQDTAMSDLTLRFRTGLVVQLVAVGQPITSETIPGLSQGRTPLPVDLEKLKLHSWPGCSERVSALPPTEAAPSAICGVPSSSAAERQKAGTSVASPALLAAAEPSASTDISCQEDQSYQLNTAVLCSNSAYFRTRITSDVGAPHVGSKRVRGNTMDEAMEASECEAAAAVLHFFYTSQLVRQDGGSCSAMFLLQMMKVADRWQAPLALTAISSILCKLQPGLFPTAETYSLLQTSAAFAEVKAHAATCLLSVFGNATAVATGQPLLGCFLSLPYAAVLALLQSEKLVTDAEATVLLLLSEWCNTQQGKACSQRKLQKLNRCIRYSRLSTPYLTELCDTLHTPPLTVKQRMELLYFRTFPEDGQNSITGLQVMCNPKGWYLSSRTDLTGDSKRTLRMNLKISEKELHRLLKVTMATKNGGAPAHTLSSTPLYAHGFWWALELSGVDGDLWCGLTTHKMSSLLTDSAKQEVEHGIMCDYSIRLRGRTEEDDVLHVHETERPVGSLGMGADIDEFDEEVQCGPLESKWWERHVVDGLIHIVASVWDISC